MVWKNHRGLWRNIRDGRLVAVIALALLFAGAGFAGKAVWIVGKAQVASVLIERAWRETWQSRTKVRPWPWADTWPVARLRIPAAGIDEIVLFGDSGAVLAFAPGLAATSISADSERVKVISGHRDTHFRRLAAVRENTLIELASPRSVRHYRVVEVKIVDAGRFAVAADDSRFDLVLVTCYPFHALTTGGRQRYVVLAKRIRQHVAGKRYWF